MMSPLPHLHLHPHTQHATHPRIVPATVCAFILRPAHSQQAQSGSSFCPWFMSLCHFIHRSTLLLSVSPILSYHLFHSGKARKRIVSNLRNCLSSHLGSGVLRSSVAEVPRSPISSSAPPAGRNATWSRTRVPPHPARNGARAFPPSKTFTPSHSSRTPGGNRILTSFPLSPSFQAATSDCPRRTHSHSLLCSCASPEDNNSWLTI